MSNLEKLFLGILVITFLWAGVGEFWDHKISHEVPFGYLASDTFQQQTRVESIKLMDNYRNEAFYIAHGFKDVVGYYPPIIHHLGVVFSHSTGIESYDTAYFMVFLLALFSALVMYVILRNYNKYIAILAAPMFLLVFASESYTAFTWGHWASITGQFFLIASVWALTRFDLEKCYIFLALFLTGIALGHTSEFVFSAGLIVFALFAYRLQGKLSISYIKKAGIAFGASIIASIYFLIIFVSGFMRENPFVFDIQKDSAWPLWSLLDFKILFVFIIIGLIYSIFLVRKKSNVLLISAMYLLLIGFGNYVGFRERSFQIRFFWPIYLSVFVGLALYLIVKRIPKSARTLSVFGISILIGMLFFMNIGGAILPRLQPFAAPGMMDQYHWDMFNWVSDNTPEDSKIFFFFWDYYSQDAMLRNTHREHYVIVTNDYVAKLQNNTVSRYYQIKNAGDSGAGLPYRTGLFTFGSRWQEVGEWDWRVKLRDICDYDYFVVDIQQSFSREPVLIQANLLMREILMKNAEEVFNNQVVSILKNNKVGEECMPDIVQLGEEE